MEKNTQNPAADLLDLVLLAAGKRVLRKVTLSKPTDPAVLRTVITLRRIGGEDKLQAESFLADNKAIQKNYPADGRDALAALFGTYRQINLITTVGDCELRFSSAGKITLIGGGALARKLGEENLEALALRGNNNEKSHILSGTEPFLKLLGVSDKDGRVLDRKRAKFNQINRFLEHIRDIVKHLPQTGPLYVCDLCCGKSYLSFAAYHYLANILGREVEMTGMDLKPDVIAYCADVASLLGFGGLHFLCGDIVAYEPENRPSLVISLHACDTATDIVIAKAIEWNAKVLLSTPCCHHELNHTINCSALAFVTDHSMLRQKLCDAATDALRLKLLEANGYVTDALELIDPEETPKNILLRAVKKPTDEKTCARAMDEYRRAKAFLLGTGDEDTGK